MHITTENDLNSGEFLSQATTEDEKDFKNSLIIVVPPVKAALVPE